MRARSASAATGHIVPVNSSMMRITRLRHGAVIAASKPGRLPQAVLAARPGDDVLEGGCRDRGLVALVFGETADQLPPEVLLVAENPQTGARTMFNCRRWAS